MSKLFKHGSHLSTEPDNDEENRTQVLKRLHETRKTSVPSTTKEANGGKAQEKPATEA